MGDKINEDNLWPELEDSKWNPISSLGPKWFGKWTYSIKGYSLMISDGIDIWGEQRNASYIENKSQEWAACLETGVKELSELVLSQLEERNAELRILPDNQNKLTIELTALLDQLLYNWLFYLTKLPNYIIERHWTYPITTTIEYMSERIFKLEEELKKKNKQLEEILPPNSIGRKDTEAVFNSCLETAVQNVVNKGIANVICSQLSHTPLITKLIDKRKKEQTNKPDYLKISSLPHNRPRPKSKKPLKGALFGEETSLVRQNSDEAVRRAQIHAMTQAPIPPPKKHKRLNI